MEDYTTSNYFFSKKIIENNKIINELLIQKQKLEQRKDFTIEKIKSYESLLNTDDKLYDDNNNFNNSNNNDILENLWNLIYKEINKIFYQFINYNEYFLFELIQELFYIIQSITKEEIFKIFNKLYSLFNLENNEQKIKEEMIFNFLPFFRDNIENIFFTNENNVNLYNFNEFKNNYLNFIEKNLKEKKKYNKLKKLLNNIIKDKELFNLFLYIKKFIIYIEILFNKSNLNFNFLTFSDRKMEIKKISYNDVLLLFNNNNNKKNYEKFFEGIIVINPPLIRNQFFLTQKLLPFAIKKKLKKSLELNLIRNKTAHEFRIKYKNKKLNNINNNILTNNNNTNSNNNITNNNNKSLNKCLYKKNSKKYNDNKKNINKLLNYKGNKLNHTNSNFKIIFTRINSFKDTLKNTFPVFTERILTDFNNNYNNNYNNGNPIMYSKTINKCMSINNNNFFHSCKRKNSLKSIKRDFNSYKNINNKKEQRLNIDDFFFKNRIHNNKINNTINNKKNNNIKNKNNNNNNHKDENNNFKNNINNILNLFKQSNSQTAETTINTDKIHNNMSNQNFNIFHDNFNIKNSNNNKKEKNFIFNTNKLNEYKNNNIRNLKKK